MVCADGIYHHSVCRRTATFHDLSLIHIYFGDGIRDNFNFRVALGRMSELGYGMLFGSDVKKQFFQKRIKGRGYCDVGTSVISEFYTPLVPKGYDFLGMIGELAHIRQDLSLIHI